MSDDVALIGQALMTYGEYTEDEDDIAWLHADVRSVLEALAAGESIEAALLDTAWTDRRSLASASASRPWPTPSERRCARDPQRSWRAGARPATKRPER